MSQAEPPRRATLFFTTGTLGYVEPCGCTSKPLGGIHRLASVIRAAEGPKALVDTGYLLFDPASTDPVALEQHRLKAALLARAYGSLNVTAANLGPGEFVDGLGRLVAIQSEAPMPWVSANVRPDGLPVAKSFLRQVGSVRFGFTGVVESEPSTIVTATEPLASVQSALHTLSKQRPDVTVLLVAGKAAFAQKLASEVPGFDFVIYGPGTMIGSPPSAPLSVGRTIVVEAGRQGQHLGALEFELPTGGPKRPLSFDDGGYAARAAKSLLKRKIEALEREIASLSQDPSRAAAVKARQQQAALFRKRLREGLGEGGEVAANVSYRLHPLNEGVRPDPGLEEMLKTYYAALKKMNLTKGDMSRCAVKAAGASTYVGNEACADCHEEAYDFWKSTKHAVAWKTLEDDNKHFDLTCVGCHTVGYEKPGGFCRLSDVALFKDVGCENCHGPGSLHAEDGDEALIRLEVPASVCADACHVPEHSDTFDYNTYLERVVGPGHGAPEGEKSPSAD